MIRAAAVAAFLSLTAAPALAAPVGDCIWGRLPVADQDAVLNGYKGGMDQGMQALQARNVPILAAGAACTGKPDTPARLIQASAVAQMMQEGSSLFLLEQRGLPRNILDRLWREAPPEARDCTRAEAAKPLGVDGPACADHEAMRWFIRTLEVAPSDRKGAAEALTYYYGVAHGELAERLLATPSAPPTAR
jgi:hypothetical protein